ncbi:MAG: FAD-binding protein [Devosiaceae bacterium]|nr:FAD-binding protein [Devosiaceae bacterium MH13]
MANPAPLLSFPPRRFSQAAWDDVAQKLSAHFGNRYQTGEALRRQHGHTTTWLENQPPDAVVFATSTEDVVFTVNVCRENRVPIVPFGTGTSLEGHVNAPEGGVCIDLSRKAAIKAINVDDLDCVVEPGVTRKQLNDHLRDVGLFFPLDPGADASLGGMAATRASGTNAVRYGTMKDVVLALEAVMPDGSVIRTGTRARKSSAGYDLTRLLIGSEGTLGIITELTLKLFGVPEAVRGVAATFPTLEAASNAVISTIHYGLPAARIELLDPLTVRAVNAYSDTSFAEAPLLLAEFHGSETAVEEQASIFAALVDDAGGEATDTATTPEERTKLWQARHDAYWAGLQLRPGARGISTDTCVPISRLAESVLQAQAEAERLGFIAPIVGHVGDGNFHVLLLVDPESSEEVDKAETYLSWLNSMAIAAGGTCTGEHGIGQGKQRYLRQELGDAVDVMATIKQAIDPYNLFNPGKVISS